MAPSAQTEGGLNAVGVRDHRFEGRLQMQEHELGVELEAERVAERRFKREPAQVVRRPA